MNDVTPEYELIVGLEVHAELATRSKMFCGCPVVDNGQFGPNTAVCPTCAGLPGALPVPNGRAVELSLRAALALGCKIDEVLRFDRKNYFYPDLPKGFQISQSDRPLGYEGSLAITDARGASLPVSIRRVHLEEDTARLLHVPGRSGDDAGSSLLDFNRSGVPLLEIVTEPDIASADAAQDFAVRVRALLVGIGVTSGEMEKGAMRFEANVSVRPRGSKFLGTRTEIKNLNSFRALGDAIRAELRRQVGVITSGGAVRRETLGWDADRQSLVIQRSKEQAEDYRYFPEPDIQITRIPEQVLAAVRAATPESTEFRATRLALAYELTSAQAHHLATDVGLADFFEAVAGAYGGSTRNVAHWLLGDVRHRLREARVALAASRLTPSLLVSLLELIDRETITPATAKEMLEPMIKVGTNPTALLSDQCRIFGPDAIAGVVTDVLAAHSSVVDQYHSGKYTAFNWLIGQVMKATQGRADSSVVRESLESALRRRGGSSPAS
jgi:aspartyl-tRNA(Asn)/glutamyl-tRNA(Gln) amidotransferase subunit B